MKRILPSSLLRVIDELGNLPGVGARTAERYAYFLLKSSPKISNDLAGAINDLKTGVKSCPKTFALIDANEELSELYTDRSRDRKTVLLVEEPLDIVSIEKTGKYNGTYHVLGGAISPVDGVRPEDLHVNELIERLKADQVEELIIATNASVEGESTAIYVQKQIENQAIKLTISRLARGIPVGVDLEYADQITLGHALEGRKTINND